jgi:BlaI family transcriptional regulator, penicillinase repressor
MKPKRTLSRLSRREREIMDVLFQMGRASAAEVHERIPSPPSYSAVRATLRILEDKGLLKHDHDGKRYIYRPALAQNQARKTAVDHLLTTFFGGSAAGAVMALLETPGKELTQEELDRMAALIERARKEGR